MLFAAVVEKCGQPQPIDKAESARLSANEVLTVYHPEHDWDWPLYGRIGHGLVNVWQRYRLPQAAPQDWVGLYVDLDEEEKKGLHGS